MLADYLSRYKTPLSLFFTIMFSLVSMVWQSNIIAVALNRSGQAFDFFTGVFDSFGKNVSHLVNSYGMYQTLKEERDALQEKLKSSKSFIFVVNDLERENKKYRQLLNLPARHDYPSMLAEVIAQDPDNWFRTVIINKGSADGIEPYMPVVAYQPVQGKKEYVESLPPEKQFVYGAVGKIIQVSPHSSRVLPLFDQYSRIGVFIEKSGHWAQLIGQSPQHKFPRIDFVSLSIFLEKGDMVLTSGGKGVFPRGIPVGKVQGEILRMGSFQQATIEPVLDFARLNTVLVIKKKAKNPADDFDELIPDDSEK